MADHLCVRYGEVVLPIEFRVAGTPISQQSHNRLLLAAWRETVAAAARAAVPPGASPVVAKVELHVVYYYEDGPTQIPDEDNLVKPVQDGVDAVRRTANGFSGLAAKGCSPCRRRDRRIRRSSAARPCSCGVWRASPSMTCAGELAPSWWACAMLARASFAHLGSSSTPTARRPM
jgi:hypothetical protein